MGTTWSLRSLDLPADPDRIQARLDALEATFSTWREDSELSRFNQTPANLPVPVSRPLLDLVIEARQLHTKSNGAFDPTVGPLVAAFGFGPPGWADANAKPCFDSIVVDKAAGTLSKTEANATLDLSALVEGYALDALAAELEAAGLQNFLLELGGELLARGDGPNGSGWTAGVQDPARPRGAAVRFIQLHNEALATSGSYIQRDGERNHLIDPRTRRPVSHETVSVSVVTKQALIADGWATALMIVGEPEGKPLAEREGLDVLFLKRPPRRD